MLQDYMIKKEKNYFPITRSEFPWAKKGEDVFNSCRVTSSPDFMVEAPIVLGLTNPIVALNSGETSKWALKPKFGSKVPLRQ